MEPDIAFPKTDDADLSLRWSGRLSLTRRILAINIFALALLAGGFFYLDSYRSRLIDDRMERASQEIWLMAQALDAMPERDRPAAMARFGERSGTRLRLYAPGGALIADSWLVEGPNYALRDPDEEAWQRQVARAMDRAIDFVVDAPSLPRFAEPATDRAAAWPELVAASTSGQPEVRLSLAPDRTPMISAGARLTDGAEALLMTTNARAITRIVRAERLRLGIVLAVATMMSVLMSLFLARTIVRPLRRLARAAVRVRLGRAREVVVPRLPSRRDEIGMLARALSDMSQALRIRIDATEAFAADVTHELKNPLASLRSAVDALGTVRDPEAQRQLLAIVHDDVLRLDRLITDIAEASRLDAQLSRTPFEPVDLGPLIENLLKARERSAPPGVRIAYARPRKGVAVVMGSESRLVRVVENLLDNAMSFSPPGGVVQIVATRVGDDVIVKVKDDGPGVPEAAREAIFRRFHSERPDGEAFGRHSGLGLAIARTIVEGHNGEIRAEDRDDGAPGACFVIRLPAAAGEQQ
jgi:two-component system sensor histidine kinase ChvG